MPKPHNRRRGFLRTLAYIAGAASGVIHAQPASGTFCIGYLHPTDAHDVAYVTMKRALDGLGYVEGRNLQLEARFAHGKADALPRLAAELVALKVDVIIAVAPVAIRAAHGATRTIPIVMAFSGDDPVKRGFAKSLNRPGGNVTGMTSIAHDFAPKWVELLHEAVPAAKRFAVLRSPDRPDHGEQIDTMRKAAAPLGVELTPVELPSFAELEGAFAAMIRASAHAVIVLSGPEFTLHRHRITALCLAHRLPSIFQYREFVAAGGLLSYGPDIGDLSARSAIYVHKILRGENPGELPIAQPTKFDLFLNPRTATELNLVLPMSLVLRAEPL